MDAAQQECARVTHLWVAGQAALLAMKLESGSPCPVCGATEHPAPAKASPHVSWQGKTQVLAAQLHIGNACAIEMVLEPATDRLYLGELGHGIA